MTEPLTRQDVEQKVRKVWSGQRAERPDLWPPAGRARRRKDERTNQSDMLMNTTLGDIPRSGGGEGAAR